MSDGQSLGEALHQMLLDRENSQGIGDRACKNNAQSPFLRCAVNPCGPCEGCNHFEERDRND